MNRNPLKCHYCGRFVAYDDVHYEQQPSWTGALVPPDDVICCGACKDEMKETSQRESEVPSE